MAEVRVVSIKGRIRESGSRLEHAPHVIYIGRRMTMGGWHLNQSPFANPYAVKACGSAQRAVELYAAHLVLHPEIGEEARDAITLKRMLGLDPVFGCWCDIEADAPCHGTVLSAAVAALTDPIPPLTTDWASVYAPHGVPIRGRETVRLGTAWAGAL